MDTTPLHANRRSEVAAMNFVRSAAQTDRLRMVSLLARLPGFRRVIAAQLRRPRGLAGRYMVRWMNEVNQRMNALTVRHARIAPDHRVLEIGFGGGMALGLMTQQAHEGRVVGIELSDAALDHAAQIYADLIHRGRLRLIGGDLQQLPLQTQWFNCAVSVNTIYFVRDRIGWAKRVRQLIQPGGRFVVSFRSRREMMTLPFTRHGFDLPSEITIRDNLIQAGFDQVRLYRGRDDHLGFVLAVASKA